MSHKDELEFKEEAEKKQENYMALGMSLGILIGGIVMSILAYFGQQCTSLAKS